MERLKRPVAKTLWALLPTLLVLILPASAGAKLPVAGGSSEAPEGVTVKGIGFAATTAEATDRAVKDAERRANVIARVLGLQLGPAVHVDVPELPPFGPARRCREQSRRGDDCRVSAVAGAVTTFAIVGGASEDASRTVGTVGLESAAVEPRARDRNRSIRHAVLAARKSATPRAATAALRNARSAAKAAGLQLGAIISVAEPPPPYFYGPWFQDVALGSFGPGRFCGIVRHPVIRHDAETGARKVIRRIPRHRCFVPPKYDVHLEVRYEAG